MLPLLLIPLPLLILAVACWIFAGRIDLKRKIKGWSGERSTTAEVESARVKILMLRIASGIFLVLAVLSVLGLRLIAAYAAR
jgi:hypothetical protein